MRLHLTREVAAAFRSVHRCRPALLVCVALMMLRPALAGEPPQANPRRTWVVEVVERDRGAVVNIHSERTVAGGKTEDLLALAPSQNRVNGMGTGIIIDPRGYIITNHHVVEDVSLIRVKLADGSDHSARVVVRDAESDLALLKIEAGRTLPVMPFGTASDLMVGESVVAIGNAYGYSHTVTTGNVSALKRDVTLNKDVSYKSLIQTDAAINPGNSGGPLLNIHGDLIGVNVAIRAGAQGIAFAIPVDSMLKVAADMMSVRRRNGLTHGVFYKDKVEPGSEKPVRNLVVERADGPAAQAGIQKGDLIVQAGDQPVSCGLEFERALLDRAHGAKVPVTVRRGGQEQKVELVLRSTDKDQATAADLIWKKLGVKVSTVTSEVVSRANSQLHGGLAVTEVLPESAASKARIERGDILVGLHQWETVTTDNVVFVLTHPDLASFNPLRFYIVRSGQVHRGWLQQVE